MRRVVVLIGALASGSCDNRQAIQEPEWTLSRMLTQRRADPYGATGAFADGLVMRTPPRGTVAQDDATDAPAPAVTRELLTLGRRRFDVVCATCHGVGGDGESIVATKMTLRRPPSLVDARYRALSREQLFVVVTDGYGLMPSYADLLPHEERWAVVSYLQALQLSQRAEVAELPRTWRAEVRDHLEAAP